MSSLDTPMLLSLWGAGAGAAGCGAGVVGFGVASVLLPLSMSPTISAAASSFEGMAWEIGRAHV